MKRKESISIRKSQNIFYLTKERLQALHLVIVGIVIYQMIQVAFHSVEHSIEKVNLHSFLAISIAVHQKKVGNCFKWVIVPFLCSEEIF